MITYLRTKLKQIFCFHPHWYRTMSMTPVFFEMEYLGYKTYKCYNCRKEISSQQLPINYVSKEL